MNRRTRYTAGAIGGTVIAAVLAMSPSVAGAVVPFAPTPEARWGVADGEVRSVLTTADRLYVGGDFTALRPLTGPALVPRSDVAAMDLLTGEPVEGFRADTDGVVRALATDGSRLFVAGAFTQVNGVPRVNFAAVDLHDGTVLPMRLDLSDSGYALRVSGSSLYVGGRFNTIGGVARRKLARVDLTTDQVDPTFSPRPDRAVWSIDLPADASRVWAGGEFTALDGVPRSFVTAVDPVTGAVVGPATGAPAQVIDLDVADDGAVVYTANGDHDNSAHAWSAVTGAQLWARRTDGNVQAVHAAGPWVYIGFHDGYQGNTLRKLLALDPATGVPDAVFQPDMNIYLGVWDLASTPSALIAGGVFTQVHGIESRRVAMFPLAPAP